MCGIVGYIGKQEKLTKIVSCLENLEYRGYDSSGIAYLKDDKINIIKKKGRIANLKNDLEDIETPLAITHTRWATHGEPSDNNAHPHKVGAVTIVHNGIIENYHELKDKLQDLGIKFQTETDTEVAAALLNKLYNDKNNALEAILAFQKIARGSYAIGMIIENDNNLYAIKKDSPLIIALSKDGYYIASDVPAILKETNRYVALKDLEFAKITENTLTVYNQNLETINYEIKVFESGVEQIDKGDFEHFMLKEIYEEDTVIKNTFNYYLEHLDEVPNITSYKKVEIIACGSAYNVGLIGKNLIEKYLDIPVNVQLASEYRYQKQFTNKDTLVIFISQSGETADTLAAVKLANKKGAKTLGIVNVKESSIARETSQVLYTKAGIEVAVATTKAYLAQLVVLIMLVYKSKKVKHELFDEEKLRQEIANLPKMIKELITKEDYQKIAKSLYKNDDMYFIGRGIDYSIALEASLKMKEISYIHSEAYASGELKHGTISLIEENVPVIGIISDEDILEKTMSNIKETKSRKASITIVTTERILDQLNDSVSIIMVPKIHELLEPILMIIPFQLLAYETAKLRGCDIDKPRNLAKSVTVE